ncbi:hypothetical protein [Bartonella sp. CB178]|uniref:hypothetical protein n=1 Tax=Bartonella sp. CB178 TaxID=3112255 RepID=UPI00300E30EE
MNIRYLFIAGAITGGLAVAIHSSDHRVIQKNTPAITHFTDINNNYTTNKKGSTIPKKPFNSTNKDLHFIERTSGDLEGNLEMVGFIDTSKIKSDDMDDFCAQGKKLLQALIGFMRSLFTIAVQVFFQRS